MKRKSVLQQAREDNLSSYGPSMFEPVLGIGAMLALLAVAAVGTYLYFC